MFQLVNLNEQVTECYFYERTECVYIRLYILPQKLNIFVFYPIVGILNLKIIALSIFTGSSRWSVLDFGL